MLHRNIEPNVADAVARMRKILAQAKTTSSKTERENESSEQDKAMDDGIASSGFISIWPTNMCSAQNWRVFMPERSTASLQAS